jgi:hypothetical protein
MRERGFDEQEVASLPSPVSFGWDVARSNAVPAAAATAVFAGTLTWSSVGPQPWSVRLTHSVTGGDASSKL